MIWNRKSFMFSEKFKSRGFQMDPIDTSNMCGELIYSLTRLEYFA